MKDILSLFRAGRDTWSMKRFCGFIGFVAVIYCMVNQIEVSYMDAVIAAVVVLLGCETFASIFWKNNNNGNKNRQGVEEG